MAVLLKFILFLLLKQVTMATVNNTGVEGGPNWEENQSVINLRNYLKIATVQPNVNYDEAIAYLRVQAQAMGIPCQVFEPVPKKPVLVMTWEGAEPALPAILLNSHMDVVPVFEKSWSHPPFGAHMHNGTIYGRGVQDMKSVAVQYIETVKALKAAGVRLKRTIHLSFVPDEEVGGAFGMGEYVKTEHYRNLNVGFSLDEGLASPGDDYEVYYAERNIWHINVICPGKSGHGSLLHENTAGDKIRYIIDKFLDLRAVYKKKLESDPDLTIGDVTTINLTILSGGIQENVVPETLTASFDVRLSLDVNQTEFEDMINRWCHEAGEGVRIEYTQKEPRIQSTKLDDSNPYWLAFKAAAEDLKLSLKKRVFAGGTDSRYIRELGVPAIGFSPINRTPPQLHEHNESLKASTFLEGIRIYQKIIPALANV